MRRNGVVCIHKVPRAGATLSIVKVAIEEGRKIVVFVPTNRITKEVADKLAQFFGDKCRVAIIPRNEELCARLKPDPKLKFQFKKECWNCPYKDPKLCPFQRLLAEDFDVYILTYDKLRALQLSTSSESERLLKKLSECDIIVFDEFSTAVLQDFPTIKVVYVDEKSGESRRLRDEVKKFIDIGLETESLQPQIAKDILTIVNDFLSSVEKIEKPTIFSNEELIGFEQDMLRFLFLEFWNLITELNERRMDTSVLQDVALVAFSKKVAVLPEEGSVYVTPVVDDALGYIRDFCGKLDLNDKIILVIDSYQPSVNFSEIFGSEVTHELWGPNGDPLRTNDTQLIVADTAHWGSRDFLKGQDLQIRVKSFIRDLLKHFKASEIVIVTTNIEMAKTIESWNLHPELKITWFRSDLTRGVPIKRRRIMICIGGPYLPKTAYVPESYSFRFEDFAKKFEELDPEEKRKRISRLLSIDDARSEFINAIARVKDPKGKKTQCSDNFWHDLPRGCSVT